MMLNDKLDLTYLKWSNIRNSSGTAGTFLKSEENLNGKKRYYKLSNFNPTEGIVGRECINEIIVDRLLTLLGVEHLHYDLIHADIEIENHIYDTYLCSSLDFKQRGESKIALDDYYLVNCNKGESHYDFCVRNGWQKYINTMIAVDYIILNRDRHGANIELLRNARRHEIRIAPLFDHGLSLLFSCHNDTEVAEFDIHDDKRCQNFIGGFSCLENLKLIKNKKEIFSNTLKPTDKSILFEGLEGVLPKAYIDKSWNMIFERYERYENI